MDRGCASHASTSLRAFSENLSAGSGVIPGNRRPSANRRRRFARASHPVSAESAGGRIGSPAVIGAKQHQFRAIWRRAPHARRARIPNVSGRSALPERFQVHALHAGGHGFESRWLHPEKPRVCWAFLVAELAVGHPRVGVCYSRGPERGPRGASAIACRTRERAVALVSPEAPSPAAVI